MSTSKAVHARYNRSPKCRERSARYEVLPKVRARTLFYEQTIR